MKTSRVNGIPSVTDEEIVKYVRRFGPVSTNQIKKGLRSKSKNFAKQVGECGMIECVGTNAAREKIWRYVEDPT